MIINLEFKESKLWNDKLIKNTIQLIDKYGLLSNTIFTSFDIFIVNILSESKKTIHSKLSYGKIFDKHFDHDIVDTFFELTHIIINKNYFECALSLKKQNKYNKINIFIYTLCEINKEHKPKAYLHKHINGYITDNITKMINTSS